MSRIAILAGLSLALVGLAAAEAQAGPGCGTGGGSGYRSVSYSAPAARTASKPAKPAPVRVAVAAKPAAAAAAPLVNSAETAVSAPQRELQAADVTVSPSVDVTSVTAVAARLAALQGRRPASAEPE